MSVKPEDLIPHLKSIQEISLKRTLNFGIGFLYHGMSPKERKTVQMLFSVGAIKVLICSYKMCWELDVNAFYVAILGVSRYDG